MRYQLKKIAKLLFYNIGILLLLVVFFNTILPFLGFDKYKTINFRLRSEPTLFLQKEMIFGTQLNVGFYETFLNDKYYFSCTNLNNFNRKLLNTDDSKDVKSPLIYFTGCSYTFGMGVSDSLTYVSLAAQKIIDKKFVNFAIPGFGTIQTYLLLKEKIEKKEIVKPDILIYNFMNFHVSRNVIPSDYTSVLIDGVLLTENKVDLKEINSKEIKQIFPSAFLINDELTIRNYNFEELLKMEFPYKRVFPICNFLSNFKDKINKNGQIEVTKKLLLEINRICKKEDINFFVSIIESEVLDSNNWKSFFKENEIKVMDLTFDTNSKDAYLKSDKFHPSERSHKIIAKKLIREIESIND